MPNIRNMIGAAAVIVGTIAVGFSPERWDTVILVPPRGHGIHVHDLFAMALVAVGIAVLWRSPRSVLVSDRYSLATSHRREYLLPSNPSGDVEAERGEDFFHADIRHLSRWPL